MRLRAHVHREETRQRSYNQRLPWLSSLMASSMSTRHIAVSDCVGLCSPSRTASRPIRCLRSCVALHQHRPTHTKPTQPASASQLRFLAFIFSIDRTLLDCDSHKTCRQGQLSASMSIDTNPSSPASSQPSALELSDSLNCGHSVRPCYLERLGPA